MKPWKIGFLYSAFSNKLVTLTLVRVPLTKKQLRDKKQKNVMRNLEWSFSIFFVKMTKEHQISKSLPFKPPFHPFRGWFRKNPFLADTYIVIGTYTPNFTFLPPVVSALRWSSVSKSVSPYIYTSWQPVLRYGESVFTKKSQGTEIFVVVALLCKFWSTSKLCIHRYLPAT